MNRRSLTALAVVIAFAMTGVSSGTPAGAQARCLDKAACREIKAEVAKLKPEGRAAKQKLKKARRALKALEPGSDRWLAKRAEIKRIKKAAKSLKRELRALKQDFRHQACSKC